MTARSVHWQDGMFMWPHHMQQEERFQSERIRLTHQWNVHHNWGLHRLELDADAFKSGRLAIQTLQARLRDGTLVDVPAEGRLPTIDLKEILAANDHVTIFVALPKLHANRPNSAVPKAAGADGDAEPAGAAPMETRYLVEEFEVTDENTGEDSQPLPFRTLNVKLLPDTQDVAGYEVLPIARFEKDPSGAGPPRFDVNYIPPLLACDAWKPLAVDILQAVFHHLGGRMDNLAGKVVTRGITFETNNPGDNVLLGRLAVLNEAAAVLNTIAFAEGIHPFTAYLELCRIVGQLAVFTGDRRAPKLPPYDHDDLGNCFYRVKRYLDEDFDSAAYEERAFVGAGLRMQVAVEAKWLESAWQMFVGAQSPLPQAELVRLLTKPGQLDMKIGSGDRVDQIFERGLKGLEFTHAPQPPRVLPVIAGLTYFQINREAQKTEWAQVQQSLTLAIRVNQNRFVVGPSGNIQGQRLLELKQQGTQAATTLQFSLFLVPGDAAGAS
jgi:type VI secretion system protein ImpJ